MTKFIKNILIASTLLTITVIYCSSSYAEQKQFRLGAVLSLTGAASVHGHSILEGAQLAIADLEKDGWQIEMTVEDDGTIPARSVTAIQSLADRQFKLFLGPTWSFLIAASAPVLERRKLLAYAPAASWEVGGGPMASVLFGTKLSSAKQPEIEKWLLEQNVKSLAVVVANSDWADLHIEVIKKAALKTGTSITPIQSYNYGEEESSLPAIVTRLAKSPSDAVFSTGSKEGLAKIARLLEDYQVKTKLFGLEDLRDAADAKLLANSYKNIKLFSLTQPMSPAFTKHFQAKYNKIPGIYADAAYDALRIYAQAIAAVGTEPNAIREYLSSKNFSYQGYVGQHTFFDQGNTNAGSYKIGEILLDGKGGYKLQ